MATYKVKQGDTLDNIAKQYGVSSSKIASANQIADPNLIKTGQTLTIPNSTLKNIANVVFSPILNEGKILSTGLNQDAQNETVSMENIPENIPSVPEKRETPEQSRMEIDISSIILPNQTNTTTGETPTTDTTIQTNTQQNEIAKRQTQLQEEIKNLEESMAQRSSVREKELDTVGVFDDMRKLNEKKAELKKLEDDKIAIGIKAKQRLSGLGATEREYSQTTSGDIEENLLKQLGTSREVEALTNVINTNIAIIDYKLKAKNDQEDLIYKQKEKELENVQKIYGDIMTEEQKTKLEDVKQKNAIELENIKNQNSIIKTASEEAIKKGADPVSVVNAINKGDISGLYKLSGNTQLTDSQTTEMVSKIDKIQGMLENVQGLKGSVGSTRLGRSILFDSGLSFGKSNTFRNDAKNLVSQETIDYFLKLKAGGATFGAMSDSEWEILSQSNQANSLGIDRQTGTSNLPEDVFKQRLSEYQRVFKKAVTADSMSKSGINPEKYLKGADGQVIDELYNRYSKPRVKEFEDELSGNSSQDFIQKQEGFKPQAYKDQAGVWTIGYGTTKINGNPVKEGDTITESEAKKIALEQAVRDYSKFADKLEDVEITPNQFTALNSFEYNLGSGVWEQPAGQEILKAIRNKDLNRASELMKQFINVKNPQTGRYEPNKGLIARRQREIELLKS